MIAALEWAIFLALSGIAVAMAAGMLLTMSMYRAGLALMSSFMALAGLFILLDAELLAAIQIMMNVGGMLVMVLFMVMQMIDPGGDMMWEMKRTMGLRGPGAFSMAMPRRAASPTGSPEGDPTMSGHGDDWTCPMHPEVSRPGPGDCPKCGMALVSRRRGEQRGGPDHSAAASMPSMDRNAHHQMRVDMAMSTSQLPWALAIGGVTATLLIVLVVRTPWPIAGTVPHGDATSAVGQLLLSRYMIGFEGAAFLILAGVVGAVILGRAERQKRPPSRAAADERIHTCPMHPEIRQPGPGQCPICGMALVAIGEAAPTTREGHAR